MQKNIEVIAFDADDTLWANENHYRDAEDAFCAMMRDYMPAAAVSEELFKTEKTNMPIYGYGAKAFTLSMIETLLRITKGEASSALVQQVIGLGKGLLQTPVKLLDGVPEVLAKLNGDYRVVLATKGDLLDQGRKLLHSGLEKHFHHIEIMPDKQKKDYIKLLKNINCKPENFLMVGNSLKSDILPVLELGGCAVHVPYHVTWAWETIDQEIDNPRFLEAQNIREVLNHL